MIRWGILGTGNIAKRFAESLKHMDDAVLFAVSGRNIENTEKFATSFSAKKYYTNYEKLLEDPEVDGVYLALPHGLHKDWAIRSLKAKKPVLCEKPAALSGKEMREIEETARENGVLFMEAMKFRFVPLFQKVIEIVESGEIGELSRIETSLCNKFVFDQDHQTYHTQPGQGGALLDEGIYCAGWIQKFFGIPKKVKKVISEVNKEKIDYYIDAELEFVNGKNARLECAFDRSKARQAVLVGEHGRIVIDELHRPQNMEVFVEGKDSEKIRMPYVVDDLYGEIVHFIYCLEQKKTESEIMPLADSIQCAEMLDLIYAYSVYHSRGLK